MGPNKEEYLRAGLKWWSQLVDLEILFCSYDKYYYYLHLIVNTTLSQMITDDNNFKKFIKWQVL